MLTELLRRLIDGQNLTRDEAASLMNSLISGEATDAQTAALLVALRIKGETVEEVAGFARAMRAKAVPVFPTRSPLIDTCGTGGGSYRVFNVSTAAAFVAAAAGLAVAKHGNRAATGVCGSADVLEALGVRVDITPEQCAECIDSIGIGFLFARSHHPSMKHVAAVRSQIGVRNVFNLIGPLTNPAGAKRQVMGVYAWELCPLALGALRELGSERALVVHADPGMDELSTFGRNRLCELRDGKLTDTLLDAYELGLGADEHHRKYLAPAAGLPENAAILRESLGEGDATPAAETRRDIVALNAAAAIRVGGITERWDRALAMAREVIAGKAAISKLESLAELTSSFHPARDPAA